MTPQYWQDVQFFVVPGIWGEFFHYEMGQGATAVDQVWCPDAIFCVETVDGYYERKLYIQYQWCKPWFVVNTRNVTDFHDKQSLECLMILLSFETKPTLQHAKRPPPDMSRWIQIRITCLTHGRAFLVQHTWLKLSAGPLSLLVMLKVKVLKDLQGCLLGTL